MNSRGNLWDPLATVDDFLRPAPDGAADLWSADPVRAYRRRLLLDHLPVDADPSARAHFEAVARSFRDVVAPRWLASERRWAAQRARRVCYVSMEFLIGRALANTVCNLRADPAWAALCREHALDAAEIVEQEPDAALGNGGLGRLAACLLDSMATLGLPATGYGLRYQDGTFRQLLRDGVQHERPDAWLTRPDPWEIARPEEAVEVHLGCSYRLEDGHLRRVAGAPARIVGVPFDRPVIGYDSPAVATLRLWSAAPATTFDFQRFSAGDFVGALLDPLAAKTLTLVLYPDDRTAEGRELRLVQEFFLAACTVADIVRRCQRQGGDWAALPERFAVQLNDTHPALAVPELLRRLLDDGGLAWADAWDLTRRTFAYTNHTLLPEALERWPVSLLREVLPRHLDLIYRINAELLGRVRAHFPGDEARVRRISLIDEGDDPGVRMAHLAAAGSHTINGVSALHSRLLRERVLPDFAALAPNAFTNVTNGITPRRFLLLANPALATLVTGAIGDGWVRDLGMLARLRPLAGDATLQAGLHAARRAAKLRCVDWLRQNGGPTLDPDTVFDTQAKRIHAYKRQLLNALHIVLLYQRLRAGEPVAGPPRTFVFAGKAAPAYALAKLVIRFIHDLAARVDAEPACRDRLRVVFLPDYRLSMAEYLIPASDVSEQISTAGFEASGTGNMKFMLNGALTVGTRDGATIEMADAVGEENLFIFGLSAEEVLASRQWYNPRWHYTHEPATRALLDLIDAGHFSPGEPARYRGLMEVLLDQGDYFMHLADLAAYEAAHARLGQTLADRAAWGRMALLNIAASGGFSSDRTVSEYATRIWRVVPCTGD